MNRITFYGGESTGSVSDRKTDTARQESTGGVGVRTNLTARNESTGGVAARIYQKEPEVKLETLQKDTVSFHGKDDNKKSSSGFGTAAALCFTAAGIIATLGYAKKLNWVDKIPYEGIRNFVTKYGAEPSYKLCHCLKETAANTYTKVADYVKGSRQG